ncbi:mitogen-activated protein kinase kinase kinase 20-like [Nicotiana sylvestris]|uniref:Mitogen-activated protein kinase kinase kinase NPK1-like n=1 Tax=Nicotiana sylvestris TaxID=4096 RepID=A0A1U7YU17_NICSY|nr:PREDICTED: mitogen-activated protein kinase kinase kinase NPK1-like [Nicotiana sylvestris]
MGEEPDFVQQGMESKKKVEVQGKKMELKSNVNEFGDGVSWYRGAMLGKGSFGHVYVAKLKNSRSKNGYLPSVMAVKSAEVSISGSIQKEREVLNNIKGCPYIIRCYGDETTTDENGMMVYNLLLEYGSGGTLAERIKKLGNKGLPEFEVRSYTRSMLRGLNYIHTIGYVHCDMKPDNILLVLNSSKGSNEFRAKIGDFGLAKRENQSKKRRLETYWRGTPMYLSPEAVADSVQESAADIWALGCIVFEMLTGKPPWNQKEDMDAEDVLKKIGEGHELPKIPGELSKEAKDFLKGCFVRKPRYRWTAEMLLNHPFVEGLSDDDGVEESDEVEDINEIGSMLLVTETDDEFSCFSEDWSCVSEGDSVDYWSEEDSEVMEDETVSYFVEEGLLKVEERINVTSSSIDSGYNCMIDKSMQVPSRSPSNNSPKCPLKFTIPAGV